MEQRRRLGLTAKFNLLTIALILATSFGIGTFVTIRGQANHYDSLLRKGTTAAAILAQNSEYGIYAEDRATLRQVVQSLSLRTLHLPPPSISVPFQARYVFSSNLRKAPSS